MSDDDSKPPRRRRTGTVLWPVPGRPPGADLAQTIVESLADGPGLPVRGRLREGDLLNHIFEVIGLINRGGMAEVYRGVNVVTEEPVAIKVILPHLADDPAVEQMFLREARTLLRLNHPALVQYRLAAREPNLGVLYLVTEFVDGPGLDEAMDEMRPGVAETVAVARRLADGLQVAHEFGAIHRDLSPDNILLPDAQLDQAKVIDFGIAKDLASTNPTILGHSFAGKLGYVAPEQLGDFGREIGPWTDIYSLGLVLLEMASGEDPHMGSNLVAAVDRRRAGVDLSKAPPVLRSLLGGMLQADPAARLRSMAAVLDELDAIDAALAASRRGASRETAEPPPELVQEPPPQETLLDPAPAVAEKPRAAETSNWPIAEITPPPAPEPDEVAEPPLDLVEPREPRLEDVLDLTARSEQLAEILAVAPEPSVEAPPEEPPAAFPPPEEPEPLPPADPPAFVAESVSAPEPERAPRAALDDPLLATPPAASVEPPAEWPLAPIEAPVAADEPEIPEATISPPEAPEAVVPPHLQFERTGEVVPPAKPPEPVVPAPEPEPASFEAPAVEPPTMPEPARKWPSLFDRVARGARAPVEPAPPPEIASPEIAPPTTAAEPPEQIAVTVTEPEPAPEPEPVTEPEPPAIALMASPVIEAAVAAETVVSPPAEVEAPRPRRARRAKVRAETPTELSQPPAAPEPHIEPEPVLPAPAPPPPQEPVRPEPTPTIEAVESEPDPQAAARAARTWRRIKAWRDVAAHHHSSDADGDEVAPAQPPPVEAKPAPTSDDVAATAIPAAAISAAAEASFAQTSHPREPLGDLADGAPRDGTWPQVLIRILSLRVTQIVLTAVVVAAVILAITHRSAPVALRGPVSEASATPATPLPEPATTPVPTNAVVATTAPKPHKKPHQADQAATNTVLALPPPPPPVVDTTPVIVAPSQPAPAPPPPPPPKKKTFGDRFRQLFGIKGHPGPDTPAPAAGSAPLAN